MKQEGSLQPGFKPALRRCEFDLNFQTYQSVLNIAFFGECGYIRP
jgi:hypothetical protein